MPTSRLAYEAGVTLLETVMFIVVVSIALTALLAVFNQNVIQSVDPVTRIVALEKAQALMDEILARKFDEHSPTGGVPACDSGAGVACAGIASDGDYDDVGDYHGYSDTSDGFYTLAVTVVEAGADLGIVATAARKVTVAVTYPGDNELALSAYKTNF